MATTHPDTNTGAVELPKLPVGAGGILPTVWVAFVVTVALAVIFSLGNVWDLGLTVGVERHVAPVIGPVVDITAIGLLVVVPWLILAGIPANELRGANRLMLFAGTLTLALNSAPSAITGWINRDPAAWGRAILEAIVPSLLIGWSHVGPKLIALFMRVRAEHAERVDQVRREAAANVSRDAEERAAEVAAAVAAEAARAAADLAEAAAARAELETSLRVAEERHRAELETATAAVESARREAAEARAKTRTGVSRKAPAKAAARAPRRSLEQWVVLAKERLPEWQLETPDGPVIKSALDLSSDGTTSKIRQRLESDRLALTGTEGSQS